MSRGKKPANDAGVGYGHPPMHTRFKKGESGNPGGRPRGTKAGQAQELILKEAYRKLNVREGERLVKLPAFVAIFRSQVMLAAKGNAPAQRAVLGMVQAIEHVNAAKQVANPEQEKPEMSELELARRIAFALERGARANEGKVQKNKKG
jgi:Family of unknown function (DUF5681)